MSRPKCYLAGPITGLTYGESISWRVRAATRLRDAGIEALSPLRGKEYLESVGKLKDQYHELHPLSSEEGITTRDRFDCTRADVVLVNFLGAERVSLGSVMECAWADAARRPLVVVLEEGSMHDHAMIRAVSGFITRDLDQALDIVIAILKEGS